MTETATPHDSTDAEEKCCDKLDAAAASVVGILQLAGLVDAKSPATRSKLKAKLKMALRMALAE